MTIETRETTIAGGPADLLEVKHVVLRGANREIGRAIAETARTRFDLQLQPAPDPVVLQADDSSPAKYPVPPTPRSSVGLHEPPMLRFLLDTRATAEEAKRALLLTKQPRQVVPAHYIVGDRFGNSFVSESSPLYNRDYITGYDLDERRVEVKFCLGESADGQNRYS